MSECTAQPLSVWDLCKATLKEWSDDHASRLAAAVAYYATFSIAPLLMIAIAMLGVIYGADAAGDRLRPQLSNMLGDKGATFVQELATKAGYSPSLSFAGIMSIILIIYAATNLFVALQDALNTIFGVEPKPGRGIKGIIADRALSFLMVILLGGLVLASVVFSTFIAAVSKAAGGGTFTPFFAEIATFLGTLVIFTGVFAALFKVLPDVKLDWKDTFIGAGLTSVMFTVAKVGLGFYLGRSSTAGPFGAAGSLVVILLFIYYSTQIMFLGAEFTQVWACRNGKPIRPADNAITLVEPEEDNDATPSFNEARRRGVGPARPQKAPASQSMESAKSYPLSPHYPSNRYHPPLNGTRPPAPVVASVAALVAVPLTWIALRKRSPRC